MIDKRTEPRRSRRRRCIAFAVGVIEEDGDTPAENVRVTPEGDTRVTPEGDTRIPAP